MANRHGLKPITNLQKFRAECLRESSSDFPKELYRHLWYVKRYKRAPWLQLCLKFPPKVRMETARYMRELEFKTYKGGIQAFRLLRPMDIIRFWRYFEDIPQIAIRWATMAHFHQGGLEPLARDVYYRHHRKYHLYWEPVKAIPWIIDSWPDWDVNVSYTELKQKHAQKWTRNLQAGQKAARQRRKEAENEHHATDPEGSPNRGSPEERHTQDRSAREEA
jgi:hypothetical protein